MLKKSHIRVMLMGSFDPLHDGHRYFFATAKRSGTELCIGVMPDCFIREIKGHEPMYNERERLEAVLQNQNVDYALILPEEEDERIAKIIELRPDVYYFGSATYNSPWNKKLQNILKEHLHEIQFEVINPYQRETLNSTRIREQLQKKK